MKVLLLVISVFLSGVVGAGPGRNERIIGGKAATPGTANYVVGLAYSSSIFCTGSILTQNYVITAAHCIVYPITASNTKVIAGTYQRYSTCAKYQYAIQTLIPHQQFNPQAIANDIGLVVTSTPMTLSSFISYIPLASNTAEASSTVQAFGYGYTIYANENSPYLQTMDTQVVNSTACQASGNYKPGHFCTYIKDKSGCNGDSGGPVVFGGTLIGVTSYGVDGCPVGTNDYNYPTDISQFKGWIRDNCPPCTVPS